MAQTNERKSKLLGAGDIVVSFEFFPPKTEKMEETLWSAISRLAPLKPEFVSVTYGAGGSTRERTHATVTRILKETDLRPAAHLTCVGRDERRKSTPSRASIGVKGVRHIVALRGDPCQRRRHRIRTASRRLSQCRRSRRRSEAHRRFRNFGSRIS